MRARDFAAYAAYALVGVAVGAGVLAATAADADPAVQAAYERGMALQKSKQTDAAIAAYRGALAADGDHVPSLYEIGWSYWVLGRWDEVVATWERVLALDPKHADAARYLPEAKAKRDALAALSSTPPPLAPKSGPALRLAFGGDTMMGSPTTTTGLPKDGGASLFDAYRDALQAADIAFLNLEGTLADTEYQAKCDPQEKPDTCWLFRTPTSYVENLVAAGLDVVSHANNHTNDFGAAGRASTLSALDRAGLLVAGPLDRQVIVERNGVRVGFLGFSTSPGGGDLRDLPMAQGLVAKMAGAADVVVVSFHGGAEGAAAEHVPGKVETFYGDNRGDVRAFARSVVDAGADLVIGHGPHVLRGMEVYKERLIAYSLGNFVVWGGFNLKDRSGLSTLLLADVLPDGRFAGGHVVAARQVHPGRPQIDPSMEGVRVLQELSRADFPDSGVRIFDDGRIEGVAR